MGIDLEKIKKEILDSILFMKNNGFTLIYGSWGDTNKKCACALGCVLIKNNNHAMSLSPVSNHVKVAEILNVPLEYIENFIQGFDGEYPAHTNDELSWYLGLDIRAATDPVLFPSF